MLGQKKCAMSTSSDHVCELEQAMEIAITSKARIDKQVF
jgi:hypothetical protein